MSDLLPQFIALALGGAIAPPLLLFTIFLGFPKASTQRHRPRARVLRYLRGDGYRRAHPLLPSSRSEDTGGREEVTQERER